ncbi:MAG TPA: hypothetical protein PLR06_03095 [Cyclobacteriaceae bacterium]|nr:hypothetical protein [Cyclobacteriaceae bacterium]
MKAKHVLLLWLSATAVYTFAQDISTPANCPLSQVVVVDGIANEWPMKWLADDDKKVQFNVCSDDNNLYLRFKTSDETFKRKIAFFGFTVWMDANGKKKKKLGFKFPTGTEGKERMEAMQASSGDFQKMTAPEREARQKQMAKSLVTDLELIELIGLSDEPLTSTRSGITNGIKVAIAATDSGAYVYEAIIPFKSYRLSKAAIEVLGIGFETGKYVPPPTKNQAGANPGASSGFGGYGRGSGYGGYGGQGYGSRPGGSSLPKNEMMLNSSAWTSIKLK